MYDIYYVIFSKKIYKELEVKTSVMDTLSFIEDIGLVYCGERDIVIPMCSLNSMPTSDVTVRFPWHSNETLFYLLVLQLNR